MTFHSSVVYLKFVENQKPFDIRFSLRLIRPKPVADSRVYGGRSFARNVLRN
jgi:hypothetical protein